jgi:quercetin dioxygenase-like cupin family protein/catechol 2,3-dioxygenase-like lactoylglutathione lyase family enzyme
MTSAIDSPPHDATQRRELSSERATSRAWWFLGTLAIVRNPVGAPRTPAVVELVVPPGGSPPRHVHDSLDDSFLLLEGEVVVRCGDDTVVAHPGSYVCLPAGVEHTFRVTSRRPARMLLVHGDDSFLSFIEAVGRPAEDLTLPTGSGGDPDGDAVARLSAEHGSPFVGPSLEEAEAASFARATDPALGPVHHLSLHVRDVSRSERWYAQAFGLVRVDGEVAEDGTGHVVLAGAGGWLVTLASSAEPGVDHVAVGCDDRDELVRWRHLLSSRGVEPGTITDEPYGSGFVLRDPDGIELELFAPPA